jgi:hypothetical protein
MPYQKRYLKYKNNNNLYYSDYLECVINGKFYQTYHKYSIPSNGNSRTINLLASNLKEKY